MNPKIMILSSGCIPNCLGRKAGGRLDEACAGAVVERTSPGGGKA